MNRSRNRKIPQKKNFAATINRLLVWDGMVEVVGERDGEGLMGLF